MPRLALIACLPAAAVLAAAAPASAVERIDATFFAEYGAPSYEIDQGELVAFANRDPFLSHGLVSDGPAAGERLFEAPVIAPKRTRLLRGAPFLSTGTYPFHCPVHADMTATLEVNAAGTPLPPDATPPAAGVKLRTARLAPLVKRRVVRLSVNPSEATDMTLVVGAGGVGLRRIERTFLVPGARVLRLKLSRKAARALKRRVAELRPRGAKRIKLVARASLTDVAGNPAASRGSRAIRLPAPRRARPSGRR
jgi:hypothetical protein